MVLMCRWLWRYKKYENWDEIWGIAPCGYWNEQGTIPSKDLGALRVVLLQVTDGISGRACQTAKPTVLCVTLA